MSNTLNVVITKYKVSSKHIPDDYKYSFSFRGSSIDRDSGKTVFRKLESGETYVIQFHIVDEGAKCRGFNKLPVVNQAQDNYYDLDRYFVDVGSSIAYISDSDKSEHPKPSQFAYPLVTVCVGGRGLNEVFERVSPVNGDVISPQIPKTSTTTTYTQTSQTTPINDFKQSETSTTENVQTSETSLSTTSDITTSQQSQSTTSDITTSEQTEDASTTQASASTTANDNILTTASEETTQETRGVIIDDRESRHPSQKPTTWPTRDYQKDGSVFFNQCKTPKYFPSPLHWNKCDEDLVEWRVDFKNWFHNVYEDKTYILYQICTLAVPPYRSCPYMGKSSGAMSIVMFQIPCFCEVCLNEMTQSMQPMNGYTTELHQGWIWEHTLYPGQCQDFEIILDGYAPMETGYYKVMGDNRWIEGSILVCMC